MVKKRRKSLSSVRIDDERFDRYRQVAAESDQNFSDWVIDILDQNSKLNSERGLLDGHTSMSYFSPFGFTNSHLNLDVVELSKDERDRLSSLAIKLYDADMCMCGFRFMNQLSSTELTRCMSSIGWDGIIIRYAKIFNSPILKKPLELLKPNEVYKEDQSYIDFHEQLIETRNKVTAHDTQRNEIQASTYVPYNNNDRNQFMITRVARASSLQGEASIMYTMLDRLYDYIHQAYISECYTVQSKLDDKDLTNRKTMKTSDMSRLSLISKSRVLVRDQMQGIQEM